MNRRNLVKTTAGLLVAPWVVKAESLMPVKSLVLPPVIPEGPVIGNPYLRKTGSKYRIDGSEWLPFDPLNPVTVEAGSKFELTMYHGLDYWSECNARRICYEDTVDVFLNKGFNHEESRKPRTTPKHKAATATCPATAT